jgi:hypothetical protein
MRSNAPTIIFIAILATNLAVAQDKRVDARQAKAKSMAYTWYDGGQPRQVWLDNSLVAEFGHRTESASKPVLAANGVRVWRQDDPAVTRAQADGRMSPIMRDSGSGRMRALPGNVIVTLDPGWNKDQIDAWLTANQLQEASRLANNVVVVSAPPGLPSLELANRLQESGKVVAAQPNWWKQTNQR